MMSLKLQVILGVILFLALVGILNMVRSRALELKYVLAWILCDLALLIMVIFPQSMGGLSRLLGISSPMNMIFFLGFLFFLGIIFSLTVALSRTTERLRKLAQSVALRFEKLEACDEQGDAVQDLPADSEEVSR